MKIGHISANNYIQNRLASNPIQSVSFGEFDGDFNDYTPCMTKSQYLAKQDIINEKYDKKRSSYLQDADDLGFSNNVVWEQLKNLEQMRDAELDALDSDYNR